VFGVTVTARRYHSAEMPWFLFDFSTAWNH